MGEGVSVYQRYRCKVGFRTFNDKTGTPFAYRHLSLQGWFWLIVLSLYGHFSWRRIGKILGVSEMTVFGYGRGNDGEGEGMGGEKEGEV
jgi:transposase-like protein